jgi:hypothetical protein
MTRPISPSLLNALRVGEVLVAEVPATQPDRRAWVAIYPSLDEEDNAARSEGWRRSSSDRSFVVYLRAFSRSHLQQGLDVAPGDGMWDIREEMVASERDLLERWAVPPGSIQYPWTRITLFSASATIASAASTDDDQRLQRGELEDGHSGECCAAGDDAWLHWRGATAHADGAGSGGSIHVRGPWARA